LNSAANGGRWGYRNNSGSYANGNPSSGIVGFPCWTVLPEKTYQASGQIAFDLYTILRANTAAAEGTIYTAFLAFMGVKRYQAGATAQSSASTQYPYREFPQTYVYPLTINWGHFNAAGQPQPAQTFQVPMDNYDFELLGISITSGGLPVTTPDFGITLYDPQKFAFSNKPILQNYLNKVMPNAHNQPTYKGIWPVPSVVYPAASQIQFDITSQLPIASTPQTYQICFQGIWRLPCTGRTPGF
jgi:hypothetical protein